MTQSRKTTLAFNSIKKHSVRYDELERRPHGDTVLKSAYISSEVFGSAAPPKQINITVDWED